MGCVVTCTATSPHRPLDLNTNCGCSVVQCSCPVPRCNAFVPHCCSAHITCGVPQSDTLHCCPTPQPLPQVRHKCLSTMVRLMHFSSPAMLEESLKDLAMSSFIATQLGARDTTTVAYAMHMSEILMDKLPAIFRTHFLKEGVVHAVEQLASQAAGKAAAAGAGGEAEDAKQQASRGMAMGCVVVAFSMRKGVEIAVVPKLLECVSCDPVAFCDVPFHLSISCIHIVQHRQSLVLTLPLPEQPSLPLPPSNAPPAVTRSSSRLKEALMKDDKAGPEAAPAAASEPPAAGGPKPTVSLKDALAARALLFKNKYFDFAGERLRGEG